MMSARHVASLPQVVVGYGLLTACLLGFAHRADRHA